jgi:glycosyltransferase involved in cell wall biosynthesis
LVAELTRRFIARAADTAALAAAIEGLFAAPALARSIGEANLDRVRETYSLQGMIVAYDDLFRQMSDRRLSRR